MTVTPSPMLCACDHQEHYFSLRRASLLDSGVTTGFYNPVAFFSLTGWGVNVPRPHSPPRSLLLCHKTNMLGATPLWVNINTPANGLRVSQGSAACGGGKGGDNSSPPTASPTRHRRWKELRLQVLCEFSLKD